MHFSLLRGGFAAAAAGAFFTLFRRRRSRRPKRLRDRMLVDDGWRALIVPAHVRLDRYGTGGDGVSRGRRRCWVGGRRVDLLRVRNIYSVSLRESVRTSVLAWERNSR